MYTSLVQSLVQDQADHDALWHIFIDLLAYHPCDRRLQVLFISVHLCCISVIFPKIKQKIILIAFNQSKVK